jgi:hypothetical protein
MKILLDKRHGMIMKDICNNELNLKEIIEGFVNDNSIFTNKLSENIKILINKLKEDGKLWSQLLVDTGGMLEMKKWESISGRHHNASTIRTQHQRDKTKW